MKQRELFLSARHRNWFFNLWTKWFGWKKRKRLNEIVGWKQANVSIRKTWTQWEIDGWCLGNYKAREGVVCAAWVSGQNNFEYVRHAPLESIRTIGTNFLSCAHVDGKLHVLPTIGIRNRTLLCKQTSVGRYHNSVRLFAQRLFPQRTLADFLRQLEFSRTFTANDQWKSNY